MDGPDAKRFLRWFFAYYHLLIAIFSLLCIFFCSTCRSGLTIFTLDERILHGACRCESSSGLLPTNWIQSLLLTLRKDGAAVICSCIDRYHTIRCSRSAQKKAQGSQRCCTCKKAFRMQFARGCGWCNQDILLPKTITLTKNRIFQLRFCRSLMFFLKRCVVEMCFAPRWRALFQRYVALSALP